MVPVRGNTVYYQWLEDTAEEGTAKKKVLDQMKASKDSFRLLRSRKSSGRSPPSTRSASGARGWWTEGRSWPTFLTSRTTLPAMRPSLFRKENLPAES